MPFASPTTNEMTATRRPDGEWIAWTPVTDEGSELWVMRADGSDEQRLAGPIAGEPSWGPDSERLVFVKPDPETDHTALWTIRRDGSDLRQITDPSRNPLD
jgi:TolB protein